MRRQSDSSPAVHLHVSLPGCVLAFALLLGAGAADAQNGFYNVTTVGSGVFTQTPNTSRRSTAFVVSHDGTDGAQFFTSRYGFNVNADTEVDTPLTKEGGAVHEIRFEVHSSVSYNLIVSTALVGEFTRREDDLGCGATADLSGVTAGDNLVPSSGSLALDDPGQLFSSGEDRVAVLETGIATFENIPAGVQTYVLGFSWTASVFTDGCEVAVRLGGPSGTTQDCTACGYPGDPARVQADDGHLVAIEFIPSLCGNNQLDAGEACDNGQFNGATSCCDPSCQIKADGAPCNDGLFCTGADQCRDGECDVHPGEDCSELGPCFFCDPVLDLCDPIVCPDTPTSTPTATTTPTPTATSTPKPLPMAECPAPPFNAASYNVNGANCLFCEVTSCSSDCLPPAACLCVPGDSACCALNPCCEGCPDSASLECTRLTCTCTPDDDDCCQTVCPCAGDCNGDGGVAVNEVVRGVNIRRGAQGIADCISFNAARGGSVGIGELLLGVENVLTARCDN